MMGSEGSPVFQCSVFTTKKLVWIIVGILVFFAVATRTEKRERAQRLMKAHDRKIREALEEEVINQGEVSVSPFTNVESWITDNPQCNPKENPFLSPVNINTEKAIRANHTQALLVYPGSPLDDLYRLQYYFQEDSKSPIVDALSINRGKDYSRIQESTHVAGLGDPSSRFFDFALILFGNKSDFGPTRSLHQINHRKFPMEIVIGFSAVGDMETTQVHIMVDETEEDNAVFFPIVSTIPSLIKSYGTSGTNEFLLAAKMDLENTQAAWDSFLETEKAETNSSTYDSKIREYQDRVISIGDAEEVQVDIPKRKGALVEKWDVAQAALDEMHSMRKGLEKDKGNAEMRYVNKVEWGELIRGDWDESLQEALEIGEQLNALKDKINKQVRARNEFAALVLQAESRLAEAISTLKAYGWKEGDASNYKPVDAVKANIISFKRQLADKLALRGRLQAAKKTIGRLKTKYGETLIQQPFQISWLFPSTGGHYAYNGSMPIPPCRKRAYVIVMEKHINISHSQFDQFLNSFNKNILIHEDSDDPNSQESYDHDRLDISIPVIWPLGTRNVWYNPKNLQFMSDDGVHMSSSVRKRLKSMFEEKVKSDIVNNRISCAFILLCVIVTLKIFKIFL